MAFSANLQKTWNKQRLVHRPEAKAAFPAAEKAHTQAVKTKWH
jgi:hypothetical protein